LPHFYVRYEEHGKSQRHPIKTKVCGTPPPSISLNGTGDAAFEESRKRALAEIENLSEEVTNKSSAFHTAAIAFQHATGRKITNLNLAKLAVWLRTEERNGTSTKGKSGKTQREGWLDWNDTIVDDFATWAKKRKCNTVFEVTRDVAHEYGRHLVDEEGYTRGSLKKIVYRLAKAFRLYLSGTGIENPFEGVYTAAVSTIEDDAGRTVKRAPLTEEQVKALWKVARQDGRMWHELAVCAACTGMRIGDCCNLKWLNVDLKNNALVDVPTAKTGVNVTIPLFDYDPESFAYNEMMGELRRILDAANTDVERDAVHVFPEAHETYTNNPSKISSHGKILFARALFGGEEPVEVVTGRPPMSADGIRQAIAAAPWAEKKRTRIIDVYGRYVGGMTYRDIQRECGYSRGQISMDLADVERLTGQTVRPDTGVRGKATLRTMLEKTREQRTVGKRAGSLYSWHSLRHAFVVMMLKAAKQSGFDKAGIEELKEQVRKMVGHTTYEMTDYYNNETRDQIVDNWRHIMGNAKKNAKSAKALKKAVEGAVDVPRPSMDDFIAGLSESQIASSLTDDQRKALAKKLLGM